MGRLRNKDKNSQIPNSLAEVKLEKTSIESGNVKEPPMAGASTQASVQSQAIEAASGMNTETENKKRKTKEEKQAGPRKRKTLKPQNSHCSNEEKKAVDGNAEETNQKSLHSSRTIGGMIFMCSAKTKPDCFRFSVMGVPANKQEDVMGIKPGLKLFLFDIDLKLMYGIYEATSAGGMKLEPKAFGGGFPAQVRFKVLKDCLPLPENMFKKAIKDNYNEKTRKFKTELTRGQAKRLSVLFRPAQPSHSHYKAPVEDVVRAPIIHPSRVSSLTREESHGERVHKEQYNSKLPNSSITSDRYDHHAPPAQAHAPHPLFLGGEEYRSHGLQPERPLLPTAASSVASAGYVSENYRPHLPSAPTAPGTVYSFQKEADHPSQLYLSEKEYRTYGLKGQEPHGRIAPGSAINHESVCNPYDDSMTSLVNRYLALPRTPPITSYNPESSHLHGTYPNSSGVIHDRRDHIVRATTAGGISDSSYYVPVLSSDNQRYHHLGAEPKPMPTTGSSCYSFAGPSVVRR